MRTQRIAITLAIAAAMVAPLPAQNLNVGLQRAIQQETVTGNLKAAIDEYRKIVAHAGSDRAVAAKALVHMAECYRKEGDAQAQKLYEQVVREYGDQKEAVAIARAELGDADRLGRHTGIAIRQVWTAPAGGDIYSPVSPDGRFIPYVNWKEYGNLFLHDLTTGAERRLTNTANDGKAGVPGEYAEGSAFSRDGKQLAYAWNGKHGYEVRVIGLQSTGIAEPRRLFENEDVEYTSPDDWSPDGKWLAVQLHRKDRTTQIALIALQDGSLRVLKSVDWRGATRLIFSPDSKNLAFDLPASDTAEQRDIFTLTIDGSRETAVVAHPGEDVLMGWSPEGKRLLFTSDRGGSMDLWSLAITDGKPAGAPELLRRDIGQHDSLGMTTSGALYYSVNHSGDSSEIQVAAFDFNAGKFLSAPVAPIQTYVGTNRSPDWSPDGKYLAYASVRGSGSAASRHFVLGIRSVETGKTRELAPSPGFFILDSLKWAPDGRSLFIAGQDAKGRDGIFRVDAQSGQSEVVVPGAGLNGVFVACSPDGRKLYYRSHASGAPQAAVVERDLASGTERELIRKTFVGAFRLSPDGRYIVANISDPSAKYAAAVAVPVSGGEPRELMRIDETRYITGFSGQLVAAAGWAPDSRSVLIAKYSPAGDGKRGKPESWWLVSVDGQSRKLELNPNTTRSFQQMHLHPDGRQVALSGGAGSQKPYEVWVLENFLPALTAKK
jgi:Tol biopolymer transport system component